MLSRLFSKRTARALGAPVPRGLMLDAETLDLIAELPAGGWRGDVVAGADGVWFSTYNDRSLSHLGPDGDVRLVVDLPARPLQLALDGDRPLVLCEGDRLLRVDPSEGRVIDDVRVPGASAVAAGDGHEESPGSMGHATFGAASGAPCPTDPELTRVRGIAERDGVRWTGGESTVRRIDVATGEELASRRLDVPRAGSYEFAHGRIWAVAWRPPSRNDAE